MGYAPKSAPRQEPTVIPAPKVETTVDVRDTMAATTLGDVLERVLCVLFFSILALGFRVYIFLLTLDKRTANAQVLFPRPLLATFSA